MTSEQIKVVDFSKLALSEESVSRLSEIVKDLHDFEKNRKPVRKTPDKKASQLKALEKMSLDICNAIDALDNDSHLGLDTELGLLNSRYRNTDATTIGAHVLYMHQIALHLAEAAKNAAKSVERREGLIGRKRVTGPYAAFVARMAVVLKTENIKAGRNGKFEAVCDEVFSAAGVPAKPEGAIRHFLKEMHKEYQERGYCL